MVDVADFVDALTRGGYVETFRIEAGGFYAIGAGCAFSPGDLELDVLERFEGDSNPDEETIVLALTSRDGSVRGTLVVAYPPDEGEPLRLLMEHARYEHGGTAEGSSQ